MSKKKISTEEKIGAILRKKKKSLALVESCTGGLVSHRITNVSGSSKYFKGTVIAYSNAIKTSVLDVPEEKIKKIGAVSSTVAKAMAEGVRKTLNTDVSAAVTGIAGPGGGSKAKPVGTAFIAFSTARKTKTKKVKFKGNRLHIKEQFADAVLEFILDNL